MYRDHVGIARGRHRRRGCAGDVAGWVGAALPLRGLGIGLLMIVLAYLGFTVFHGVGDVLVLGALATTAAVLVGRAYGPGRAGGAVRRRGDTLALQGLGLGVVALVFVCLAVAAVHGVWRLVFFGVAFVAGANGAPMLESAIRWRQGASGARRVALALRPLEERGWRVEHDLVKRRGGNVDHVVHGPSGHLFTIETKLQATARAT